MHQHTINSHPCTCAQARLTLNDLPSELYPLYTDTDTIYPLDAMDAIEGILGQCLALADLAAHGSEDQFFHEIRRESVPVTLRMLKEYLVLATRIYTTIRPTLDQQPSRRCPQCENLAAGRTE